MTGAAALVTAGLGLVTNYASVSVPGWAADPWVVWLVFAVLLGAAVGLLLWGRHLDTGGPAARLTPVDRLAGSRHASLRRPHVERVRGRGPELAVLTRMLRRPQNELAVVCGAGGLGKTTVAAQLAALAEEDGWQVFWVRWRDSVDLAQLASRHRLAKALDGMGRYAQAADHHRHTLDDRTRVLGPDHPDTLTSRNTLANALYGMGRYAQAADHHRHTLDDRTRVLGPDHPDTLT
ncbi:tetratricopeptide repeat protein, partial [Streptomyces afghaniensis]|uniref:tetratricopeptide repeat protein n=1 Tax=Streptomyces afghaniensis TaxID=66865 RepID=UPI0033AA64AF